MRLDELRTGLQAFMANAARSSFPVVGNRVYYWPWPQGATLPLLAIARVSSGGLYHRMGSRATPVEVDFQVSAFASSVAQAEQALALAIDDLDGYAGAMGSISVGMVKLMTMNPEVYETDSGLFHCSADVRVSYEP